MGAAGSPGGDRGSTSTGPQGRTTSRCQALWMSSSSKPERVAVASLLTAIGAVIIYVIAFAHSTTLHNAAHDVRHAFAFPCH